MSLRCLSICWKKGLPQGILETELVAKSPCEMVKAIGELKGKEAVKDLMPLLFSKRKVGNAMHCEIMKVMDGYDDRKDADNLVSMLHDQGIDEIVHNKMEEAIQEIRKRIQESGETSEAR